MWYTVGNLNRRALFPINDSLLSFHSYTIPVSPKTGKAVDSSWSAFHALPHIIDLLADRSETVSFCLQMTKVGFRKRKSSPNYAEQEVRASGSQFSAFLLIQTASLPLANINDGEILEP